MISEVIQIAYLTFHVPKYRYQTVASDSRKCGLHVFSTYPEINLNKNSIKNTKNFEEKYLTVGILRTALSATVISTNLSSIIGYSLSFVSHIINVC